MKKILKIQLLFISLIFAFSSCENSDKSEKQKLVDAFEQYVNGLTPADLEQFNPYLKKDIAGNLDDTYYDFTSSSINFDNTFRGINMHSLAIAEKGMDGDTVHMKTAFEVCKFENKRRLKLRNVGKEDLEQSVYFSIRKVNEWIAKVDSLYGGDYKVAGFRAYFGGYPEKLVTQRHPGKDLNNRSTVVLRAMYQEKNDIKPDSILKIQLEPLDAGSDKDILTFNLGGLCPPRCQGAEPNID